MSFQVKFTFVFLSIFLWSCNEPKPKEIPPLILKPKQVIILNEGGFTYNNSEISLLDIDSNLVYNNVFYKTNNLKLGDILQSVSFINNKFYWVINNSGKIIITDTNFVQSGQITGLTSPRYIHNVNNIKAYVSDFSGNQIAIINLANNSILGHIKCVGFTENFIKSPVDSAIWVSNRASDKIYKIDSQNDHITDSITLSYGPSDMAFDINNHLWIGCGGDDNNKIKSAIYCLDLEQKKIIKKLETSSSSNFWSSHLCFNNTKDTLFWIDAHLKKMSISENQYPSFNFIESNGRIFYGLNIDPTNNQIYLTDAVDYSQDGYVLRYSHQGNLLGRYKVGIIPNGVFFK